MLGPTTIADILELGCAECGKPFADSDHVTITDSTHAVHDACETDRDIR